MCHEATLGAHLCCIGRPNMELLVFESVRFDEAQEVPAQLE
jgi:hypothetical protein